MNRKKVSTGLFLALCGIFLLMTQCKKEEAGSISGTVSVSDGIIADGAIVTLSSGANGTDVVTQVVANENGSYKITTVDPGTYYISATWDVLNNNNAEKAANTVILSSSEQEVKVDGDKSVNITLSGKASDGTAVIDLQEDWIYDASHSTVEFQFPYDAVNAVFKGHFARTGIDVFHFDESTPANTEVKAWVDLVSVETGSPSDPCGHTRDGIQGCIAGTFGVETTASDTVDVYCTDGTLVTDWPNSDLVSHDLWGDGSATTYTRQSAIVGNSGVATIEFSSATAYGTGYKASADFTFNGITETVDLYFTYLEGFEGTSRSGDETSYVSLFGTFKFAALDLFGIESGHVGDADITVNISIQFNKVISK